MDKQSIYLISAGVVFILFVIFLIILLKKKRVINLQKQVQELERQRNLIVSTPIAAELAKIEVIVKNEKLESKYEEWKERYRVIKENRFQVITDMLLEIDGLIDANDIKNAKQKIMELEMEIYKLRVSTDNLLDEIREVTMSEERNRAIVTKLKSKFRDLERTFTTNQASYGDIDKYIELQFENIEKRFQEFETIMENNNYSEIVSSVKVLDEMIAHISTVIEEVPDLLLLTNKIIPSRIEEIKETYKTLLSKNYPLSYLNVDYNIEQIEKKVKEILDKVKILNLEDSMLELKTFLDYLDNLINDFEIEKLEDEYKEKISVFTLTSDDILNLISKKSGVNREELSVISYQQTIDDKLYYYAEVVRDNKIFNEVLVEAKDKKIYSYKSEKVDYGCEYSDGYYKVDEQGNYVFAISSKDAATLVKDKLSDKHEKYNDLEMKYKSEITKYVNEDELNKLLKKNNNIYYYALVKKGWFSLTKEVYLVNMYDKTIYKCIDDKISKI